MKMIISAGGTGGHIYPALAIIKKFQAKDKDFEVLYIGTHNRMENNIVPQLNIPFKQIKIYGLSKNIFKDVKNVSLLINAYYKCLKIMEDFKPDIVVGVGGYVTMPVIMAAKKLKIKCVIHEQNSIPGKTNKFLSRGVNAVFTSFKDSNKYFPKEVKCIHTGNPSADNVFSLKPINKESLGLSKEKKLVLITSGSLGSMALNEKLIEFLKLSRDEDYEVLFITGNNNYEEFKKTTFSKNIKILPYINNLAALFKSCDLVIARAGAGTIFELLASKTPSILIPSPNVANNHQYYNALDLNNNNLAIMIQEDNLNSKELYQKVKGLLSKNQEYKQLITNLEKYKIANASDKIYNEIKEIVKDA